MRNYGIISTPLTDILKKDAFKWSPEDEEAYIKLKQIMGAAPVLALSKFNK